MTLNPDKKAYRDQALSCKSPDSIEAVSPRDIQREVREAACDPIDFEMEYRTPNTALKQIKLDDID